MILVLQLSHLFFKLSYPLSLLPSCLLELLPLLLDVIGKFLNGSFVDVLALLDLSVQVVPLLLIALCLLILVMDLRLVLGDLSMQSRVLFLEALDPFMQLLTTLITLVHLL